MQNNISSGLTLNDSGIRAIVPTLDAVENHCNVVDGSWLLRTCGIEPPPPDVQGAANWMIKLRVAFLRMFNANTRDWKLNISPRQNFSTVRSVEFKFGPDGEIPSYLVRISPKQNN